MRHAGAQADVAGEVDGVAAVCITLPKMTWSTSSRGDAGAARARPWRRGRPRSVALMSLSAAAHSVPNGVRRPERKTRSRRAMSRAMRSPWASLAGVISSSASDDRRVVRFAECLADPVADLRRWSSEPPSSGVVRRSRNGAADHGVDARGLRAGSRNGPASAPQSGWRRGGSRGLCRRCPARSRARARTWRAARVDVAEGARPSPPASAAPRSVRMSPKRLFVTMTS